MGLEGLSANTEDLAMWAAFESNVAHTTWQSAQERLGILEGVAALGLEDVVDEVIERAAEDVRHAQRDFEALSAMTAAIIADDGPPAAVQPAIRPKVKRAAGRKTRPKVKKPEASTPETPDLLDAEAEAEADVEMDILLRRLDRLKSPKERLAEDDRAFNFSFRVNGRLLSHVVKVGELRDLPIGVKVLLGFGQAHASSYDFYKTEAERRRFVLRLINKGIYEADKLTDGTGLQARIDEAIENGHLYRNGNGLELTSDGMDLVCDAEVGATKLGQTKGSRESYGDDEQSDEESKGATLRLRKKSLYDALAGATRVA